MNKSDTGQCLIHISSHYSTKNTLERIAKSKVESVNHVIMHSHESAEKLLQALIDDAKQECSTRCKPISWSKWGGVHTGVVNMSLGFILVELLPVYKRK